MKLHLLAVQTLLIATSVYAAPIINMECSTFTIGISVLNIRTETMANGTTVGDFAYRLSDLQTSDTTEHRMQTNVIFENNLLTLTPRTTDYPKVSVDLSQANEYGFYRATLFYGPKITQNWDCKNINTQ